MPVPQIVRIEQGYGTCSWTDGPRYHTPTPTLPGPAKFSEGHKRLLSKLRAEQKKKETKKTEEVITMGKSTILTELDNTYIITVMQYSNKGILFVLTDKITYKERDRFLWEYPVHLGEKGNIRRFT